MPLTLGCRGALAVVGKVSWRVSGGSLYADVGPDGYAYTAHMGEARDAGAVRGLVTRLLEDEDATSLSDGDYEAEWSDDDRIWVTFRGRSVGMDVMDADRLMAWLDEVSREASRCRSASA